MKFADIVRSAPDVRQAFDGLPVHSIWWRLVLALHGKPTHVDPTTDAFRMTAARGFRFYGFLYAVLSGTMMLAAGVVAGFDLPDTRFWVWCLALSSVYLLLSCQLAFHGARRYQAADRRGTLVLVAFFVSVMAYLSSFIGAGVAIAHFLIPEHDLVVLPAAGVLLLFGVGSYMIEVLFLVSHHADVAAE